MLVTHWRMFSFYYQLLYPRHVFVTLINLLQVISLRTCTYDMDDTAVTRCN